MKYKSAIKAMFYEGRGMSDGVRMSERYKEIINKVVKSEEIFLDRIKDNRGAQEAYKELESQTQKLKCEEVASFYEEGFRFGVLLGLDIAGYIKDE